VSRRTVLWIVVGAVLFHAALFLVFGRMRALPKTKYIPPPNFDYREQVYENPRTGERTVFREIEVSTKLADPKKLPPRPDYGADQKPVNSEQ
jgi:hypothetical protein